MSDYPPQDPNAGQGWNAPPPPQGQQPPPPQQGGQWGQQPPPPQQGGQWGQQPPPPQQGGQWGQQPAAPQQWGQQAPQGGGGGLEPNIGAMLSYLLFGWVGGLIMYFTQKHPEVRFHAAQSILFFGPLHAISILLGFFGGGFFGFGGGLTSFGIFFLISSLLNLFAFVMWIFLSIQGYQLKHFKLPVVGDMAEQWAAKPA